MKEKCCTRCATFLPIESFYTTGKKVDGSPKYNSWCKACVKIKMASYHEKTWGPDKLSFTNLKRSQTTRSYLSYLLAKAKKRRDCTITLDDLEKLWDDQNGLCALTNWELTKELGKGVVTTNASLDRIDSSKSYTKDNVQLVCRAVNVAKSDLSQGDFLNLCRAVIGGTHGET